MDIPHARCCRHHRLLLHSDRCQLTLLNIMKCYIIKNNKIIKRQVIRQVRVGHER